MREQIDHSGVLMNIEDRRKFLATLGIAVPAALLAHAATAPRDTQKAPITPEEVFSLRLRGAEPFAGLYGEGRDIGCVYAF